LDDLFETDPYNNQVQAPFTFELTSAGRPRLSAGAWRADGAFQLAVFGSAGAVCRLEASTNLVTGTRVCDFLCLEAPTLVADPDAPALAPIYELA